MLGVERNEAVSFYQSHGCPRPIFLTSFWKTNLLVLSPVQLYYILYLAGLELKTNWP